MAMLINVAMFNVNRPHPPNFREAELERLLADAFRRAAWKMTVRQRGRDQIAFPAVANRKHRYAVEFKATSEGRGDRLIPLLAQAILTVSAALRRRFEFDRVSMFPV